MNKLNKKGFTAVETALILLVVLGLGFAGYTVWKSSSDNAASSDQTGFLTYNDTADKFMVDYPADWEATTAEEGNDNPDNAELSPDDLTTSRNVQIKPADGYVDNVIRITPGCTSDTIAAEKANKDQFHTHTDLKINDYDAFYDKVNFKGDAESYIDHRYYVLSGENCVELSFRESYSNNTVEDADFDDEDNLEEFEAIVNSLTFNEDNQ